MSAPLIVLNGIQHRRGIDTSVYQGQVDWDAVSKCADWACLKASGGDGGLYADRWHTWNKNASRGKVKRSAYHFLGQGDGAAQADIFMRATNGYDDYELPPVVDIETYGNQGQFRPSSTTIRQFVTEIHRQCSRRWTGPQGDAVALMVYTGAPLANVLFSELAIFDLWLAAYLNGRYPNPADGITNGCLPNVAALGSPNRYIPSPWRQWSVWQFAGGDGGIQGVSNGRSNCDQDVMREDVYRRLLGGSTQAPKEWDEMASKEEIRAEFESVASDVVNKILTADAQWEGDTRALVIGDRAVRIDGRNAQFLICSDRTGIFKVHIPDPATLNLLRAARVVNAATAENVLPADSAEAAALLALPGGEDHQAE